MTIASRHILFRILQRPSQLLKTKHRHQSRKSGWWQQKPVKASPGRKRHVEMSMRVTAVRVYTQNRTFRHMFKDYRFFYMILEFVCNIFLKPIVSSVCGNSFKLIQTWPAVSFWLFHQSFLPYTVASRIECCVSEAPPCFSSFGWEWVK